MSLKEYLEKRKKMAYLIHCCTFPSKMSLLSTIEASTSITWSIPPVQVLLATSLKPPTILHLQHNVWDQGK